jgi:hypothetical protein
MAVRLLTVTSCEEIEDGLRVSPGVPMEEMSAHEELRHLMSNGPVELRCPDGTVRTSRLLRFGASVSRVRMGASTFPVTRVARGSPLSSLSPRISGLKTCHQGRKSGYSRPTRLRLSSKSWYTREVAICLSGSGRRGSRRSWSQWQSVLDTPDGRATSARPSSQARALVRARSSTGGAPSSQTHDRSPVSASATRRFQPARPRRGGLRRSGRACKK